MQGLGRTLVILGVVLIAVGLLAQFTQIGRLPGDITVRRKNFTFYFPLMTSLLLSAALTLIFWFLRRK